jgi:hypothetical protein
VQEGDEKPLFSSLILGVSESRGVSSHPIYRHLRSEEFHQHTLLCEMVVSQNPGTRMVPKIAG